MVPLAKLWRTPPATACSWEVGAPVWLLIRWYRAPIAPLVV